MYCSKYGEQVQDGVQHCTSCEAPIIDIGKTNSTVHGKKKSKKIIIIAIVTIIVLAFAYVLYNWVLNPYIQYQTAEKLLAEKNYQAAVDKFVELGDYKDSKERVSKFVFVPETETDNNGDVSALYSYTIDDKGQISYASKTGKYSNTEYAYVYENGLLKQYTETYIDDGDKDEYSGEYEYDDNGRLISGVFRSNTSHIDTTRRNSYEYNEPNNIKMINSESESYIYNTGEISTKKGTREIEYNSDNNVVQIYDSDYANNELIAESKFTYKYEGNYIVGCTFVRTDHVDSNNNVTYEDIYEYDKNGYLIKAVQDKTYFVSSWNDKTGVFHDKTEYFVEYDNLGHCVCVIMEVNSDEMGYSKTEKNFNENGNMISITKIDSDMNEQTYKYEYDEYGNMISDGEYECRYTYKLVGYSDNMTYSSNRSKDLMDVICASYTPVLRWLSEDALLSKYGIMFEYTWG